MTAIEAQPLVYGEQDVPNPDQHDQRFWSVTTILSQLDKPALLYWASEQTANAACDQAPYLQQRIENEGRETIVKELRDARFKPPKGRRSATELGTAVHDACEQYALTGQRPEVDDEVRPFLEQFDRWAQRWQPKYEAAEMAVYNLTYGYAGTTDFIAVVDGVRFIGDYKSSAKDVGADGKPTGPYPEVALQLAAYRHAELAATWRARRFERYRRRYYLLSEAEKSAGVPMPEVDGGLVIHITPGHCTARPVKCDAEIFDAFTFAIEIARWQIDTSKTVIGPPLEGGHRAHT